MERYSISFIIFIIFVTLLPLANATNLVPDTCTKISKSNPNNIKYDYCVKVFESDSRSKSASFKGLAEISYNLTSDKAKSIVTSLKKLLKDPKIDPSAKSALETCTEVYTDAQDELKEGVDAMKAGDLSKANVRISAALESGTDCEDAFTEKKGGVSPITKENTDYVDLTRILLAFTVLLKVIN